MRIVFVIPGDINLPTGGYRYDREIINTWKETGIDVELVSLDGSYPFPSDKQKKIAIEEITSFPKADIAVVDGLLGGASPEFLQELSNSMPVVSLLHHPLCLENGLEDKQANTLETSERQGLEFVSSVITTSETTTKTVADLFGFKSANIHTVLPGVNRTKICQGSKNETLNLLCIGSVIHRKGHSVLLKALAKLTHLNWHLDCYGSTSFDEPLFSKLKTMITENGLSGKVIFHGAVDDQQIEDAYAKADLFVLPSQYEGYGMVYAEAIVRGLPIIGTTAGAIPKTVPKGCGILVEPENEEMLKQALEKLITDQALRLQYKENTIKAEPNFPTWQGSAKQFARILRTQI